MDVFYAVEALMSDPTQQQAHDEWLHGYLAEIFEKRFGHLDFMRLPAKGGIYTKQMVYRSVAREVFDLCRLINPAIHTAGPSTFSRVEDGLILEQAITDIVLAKELGRTAEAIAGRRRRLTRKEKA